VQLLSNNDVAAAVVAAVLRKWLTVTEVDQIQRLLLDVMTYPVGMFVAVRYSMHEMPC
jgi:hypothetical protein